LSTIAVNFLKIAKKLRTNHQIFAQTIRLVGNDGEQAGIMGTPKALQMAKDAGLDLIEVAPDAKPPVCKIADYGKYLYHQDKVDRKHKKQQKKTEIKGIRIGFKTGDHDLEVRANQSRKFLLDRNLVKVTLLFKGREVVYTDLARQKMKAFYEKLADIADVEQYPKSQGNTLTMILTPKKNEAKDTQRAQEKN